MADEEQYSVSEKEAKRVSEILGQNPGFGLPAEYFLPVILSFIAVLFFHQLVGVNMGMNLYHAFFIWLWFIASWVLVVGKNPHVFWGRFISPPKWVKGYPLYRRFIDKL